MSDSPTGPWTFKNYIMAPTDKSRGNHPGIMDYKGKSYVFGLNYDLMHSQGIMEHHERRSVSVAEMHYRKDGTIEEVPYWTKEGVAQIGHLNPYKRVEAETMAWSKGVKSEKTNNRVAVNDINNGDYIMLKGVNFGKGAKSITINAAPLNGGTVEIRIDNINGKSLGTCKIAGEENKWSNYTAGMANISGVHDLYLVFKGDTDKQLFKLDCWQMKKR